VFYKKAILFFAFLLAAAPGFCQAALEDRFGDFKTREYMPGDIVHIIVEAPFDTQQVSAVMPDEQRIDLSYDGRRAVWHGYWEVPYGFKKGVYTAVLLAVDVAGKTFEGRSSQLIVGEPTMALLVQLSPKQAAASRSLSSRTVPSPRSDIPAPTTTLPPPRPASPVPSVPERVTKPVPAPRPVEIDPFAAEIADVEPPIKKTIKKPAIKKSRIYSTASKQAVVKTTNDLRVAQLTLATREFMARQDYVDARQQLIALSKIEPKNYAAKAMIARLENIIRARGK